MKAGTLSAWEVVETALIYRLDDGCVVCAGLRKYRGRVSFLPVDEYRPRPTHSSAATARPQQHTSGSDPATLSVVHSDSTADSLPTPAGPVDAVNSTSLQTVHN